MLGQDDDLHADYQQSRALLRRARPAIRRSIGGTAKWDDLEETQNAITKFLKETASDGN